MTSKDSWQPEIGELRRLDAEAELMGGPDKLARQHEHGELTGRERIDELVDPGFVPRARRHRRKQVLPADESRRFQPANFVFGRAALDGRPSSSAATTSRCAAAPAMPRSPPSR